VKNRENIQNKLRCCGWEKATTGHNCPAASEGSCWDKLLSGIKDGNQVTLKVVITIAVLEVVMLICTVILAKKLLKIKKVPRYVKYCTASSPDAVAHCDTLVTPENAYTNFRRSPKKMI